MRLRTLPRGTLPRAASLPADVRGVAALEFALLAPVLILIYFGVVELTQGAMAEQRVAHTASVIGDLAAQSNSLTQAEVNDILSVGDTIMAPYPTQTLEVRVSSLTANAQGAVTVAWSEGAGMTPLSKGSTVSGVPSDVISANGSVIMSQAQYTYTSAFQSVMPKPVVFNETYYLSPRDSTSVACADC